MTDQTESDASEDATPDSAAAPAPAPAPAAPREPTAAGEAFRTLLVAGQLTLILLVVRAYAIQEIHGFVELAPWILGGFLVHAFLPMAWRKAFFVLLTFAGIVALLGPFAGGVLIATGLGFIGLCHLPISFVGRIALILGAAMALALLRAEIVRLPGQAIWLSLLPIFGSIFMFRMIVYLYELRYAPRPDGLWHRLGYFFLVPCPCFPMFPVVDYKTFGKTWYDDRPSVIYQKGVRWMLRGVLHLLFYRMVYQHVIPSPAAIAGPTDFLQYVVSSFLLYARISGQFHLVVGVIVLFGFNLPTTHNYFFLSSSFSAIWRRLNTYWRQFMTKIAFYPVYFRCRKMGEKKALTLAMIIAFGATWLLHSYQWFWLRGTFPLSSIDAIFWLTLGGLVVISAALELNRAPKKMARRPKGPEVWSWSGGLVHSLKVTGVFLSMCLLVAFWTSSTLGEWMAILGRAGRGSFSEFSTVLLFIAALPTVGTVINFVWFKVQAIRGGRGIGFSLSAVTTTVTALALLAAARPDAQDRMGTEASDFIRSVSADALNRQDADLVERGYYETLLGEGRYTSQRWRLNLKKPHDWKPFQETDLSREEDRLLADYGIRPSVKGVFHRARFESNRWGMRDRDYELENPETTYRVALFGGSYSMGSGVNQDESWESLLEVRLNENFAGQQYERFEILNFSVPGYSVAHRACVAPERIAQFKPDAVVTVLIHRDAPFLLTRIGRAIRDGKRLPPKLEVICRKAGLDDRHSVEEIAQRLRPQADEIILWSWREIERAAYRVGATPILVTILSRASEQDAKKTDRILSLAARTNFHRLELTDVFRGVPPKQLRVAPWDSHPNPRAHRLIARRLYEVLRESGKKLNLDLSTPNEESDEDAGH